MKKQAFKKRIDIKKEALDSRKLVWFQKKEERVPCNDPDIENHVEAEMIWLDFLSSPCNSLVEVNEEEVSMIKWFECWPLPTQSLHELS